MRTYYIWSFLFFLCVAPISVSTFSFYKFCGNKESQLNICRKTIDKIDDSIYELLLQRMKVCKQVGKLKSGAVEDPLREKKILDRLYGKNGLRPGFVDDVWTRIFFESKFLQYSS